MKKKFGFALLLAGFGGLLAFNSVTPLNPSKDKLLIELVAFVLNRGHFSPADIDDDFSENVFMNYLNGMDGRHHFFIQADIDNFRSYKHKLDDQIKAAKIDFFNQSFEKFMQRMTQVKGFFPVLLEKPFDFTRQETYDFDYENQPFAASLSELKQVWRKYLKFNALGIYTGLKETEKKKKEDPSYTMKSDAALEQETREILQEDMRYFFEARDDLNRNDYFRSTSMPLRCNLIRTPVI